MVSGVPRCGGHKRQHVGCPAGSAWEAGLGPGQPGEDMLFLHPAGSSLDEPSHPLLWSARQPGGLVTWWSPRTWALVAVES